MKKVRLNLKRGVKSWTLMLYDSAESAFYLKDEPVYGDAVDQAYRKIITLKQGDVLEAEWIGSEWVYEEDLSDFVVKPMNLSNKGYDKYDKVRVGKLSNASASRDKPEILEFYSGWVLGGHIPWFTEEAQRGVRITEIKGKTRPKVDFSKASQPQEAQEDEFFGDGNLN